MQGHEGRGCRGVAKVRKSGDVYFLPAQSDTESILALYHTSLTTF